jgi:hypothetical protein
MMIRNLYNGRYSFLIGSGWDYSFLTANAGLIAKAFRAG